MNLFVPKTFVPKELIIGPGFMLRKLTAKDIDKDYEAVMSNIDLIHQVRGGSWPETSLTKEEDLIDLCWHQRELEFGTSFAYMVLSANGEEYLGCVYIYPTNKPWIEAPEQTDAVVNMWVTQQAYDQDLYRKLFQFMEEWIKSEWPFTNVYYSNNEKPI